MNVLGTPAGRTSALLSATLLGGVALALAPPTAHATIAFNAVASADVMHVSYFVTDAPLAESIVDGGSPSAQAALDTVGNSTAQATAADPGPTVTTLPGTGRGTLPVATPIPDYPFVAASRFPTRPSSETTAGPYALTAKSDAQRSTADAGGDSVNQGGIGVGKASAHADTSTDGSQVTTTASNDSSGIAGLALQMGVVHSKAALVYDGSTYAPTSEFTLTGFSVAGVALDLGPQGLSLAGQQQPLPDSSPVRQILADQGLTVRYLAPQTTKTSVLSAGVEIDKDLDPPAGAPIRTIKQSLVLGRSFVAITNASTFDAAPGATVAQPPSTAPGSPTTTGSGPVTAGPIGVPPLLAGGGPAPGSGVAVPPAVTVAGSTPAGSAVALSPRAQVLPRSLDLFPPFVVGALALLVISQTSRLLGVRQP